LVAAETALATQPSAETMLASATPFTPNGWKGLGTSTMIACSIGRSEATGIR